MLAGTMQTDPPAVLPFAHVSAAGASAAAALARAAAVSPRSQVCAAPDQLLSAVRSFDASTLQPFPARDGCSIADAIDDFMDRPCKTA